MGEEKGCSVVDRFTMYMYLRFDCKLEIVHTRLSVACFIYGARLAQKASVLRVCIYRNLYAPAMKQASEMCTQYIHTQMLLSFFYLLNRHAMHDVSLKFMSQSDFNRANES